MSAGTFDVGDSAKVQTTFTVGGTATDPTTVTLKWKLPSGTVNTYTYAAAEITRSDTGVYYKELDITTSGTHTIRWEGTGTAKTAGEDSFTVRVSAFP